MNARDSRKYCLSLGEFFADNWFDRHDVMASWNQTENRFFCDNKGEKGRDYIAHALADSFMGRGPAKHRIIGSYFIDPKTLLTRSTCLDMDAHKKDADTAAVLAAKTALMLEETERIEYAQQLYQQTADSMVVAKSKSGNGFHIRNFFDKPCEYPALHNFGEELIRAAGIDQKNRRIARPSGWDGKIDQGPIEINPKQESGAAINYGNQVAIPGSRWYYEKKGGSCLVEPRTHREIPFGDWLDYLKSVKSISVDFLREKAPQLWVPKQRERAYSDVKLKIEGVPEIKTVTDLCALLERHGLKFGSPMGAGGVWTDKIILKHCPNEEAHGSSRADGAAVLFNATTGRVGFKCHHAGCEASQFSWPKLLKKLGYKIKREYDPSKDRNPDGRPWGWDGEWPPKPTNGLSSQVATDIATSCRDSSQDPAPEGTKEKKKRRERPGHAMTSEDKRRTLNFALYRKDNHDGDPRIMRVAAKLRDVGNCLHAGQDAKCGTHGAHSTGARPCDEDRLCANCSRRAADMHEAFVEANWPEQVVMVKLEAPDRKALIAQRKAENEKIKRTMARKKGPVARYIEGATSQLLFWPERFVDLVRLVYPHASVVSREEAAKAVGECWYEPFLFFSQNAHRCLIDLVHDQWIHTRKHRTGGGKVCSGELAMTDVKKERKKKSEEWKKEHPGLERGQCDEVVGTDKDGKPIFCGCKLETSLVYRPTGEHLSSKLGAFRKADEIKVFDETGCELRWIQAAEPAFAVAEP